MADETKPQTTKDESLAKAGATAKAMLWEVVFKFCAGFGVYFGWYTAARVWHALVN